MKQGKRQLIRACIAIGLSGLMASAAVSAALPPHYIQSITLAPEQGINSNLVVLENVSANKHIDAIQIAPTKSNLDIALDGHLTCEAHKDIEFDKARAYFGPSEASLYSAAYDPNVTSGKGQLRITEYGNDDAFSVPLAQIKQGHPAVRFDPIHELDKALQQHINNGGTKLSFYQQEQIIKVKRPVSMKGWCKVGGTNDSQSEDANANIEITVIYQGDPDLKLSGTLNAQLANVPNQIGNNLPIKLDKADFQPNLPHYYGQCLPESDPKIQVNLQFSGATKGLLDLKVVGVSNAYADYGSYYEISAIPVNAQHSKKVDIYFPLKAMLSQDKYAFMMILNNEVYNHNMKIVARVKPEGKDWSQWQEFDTAVFKHRCLPQVQVNSPAAKGGYQQHGGGESNQAPSRISPVQIKPAPTPAPDRLQAPKEQTEPRLQLKAVPQK